MPSWREGFLELWTSHDEIEVGKFVGLCLFSSSRLCDEMAKDELMILGELKGRTVQLGGNNFERGAAKNLIEIDKVGEPRQGDIGMPERGFD